MHKSLKNSHVKFEMSYEEFSKTIFQKYKQDEPKRHDHLRDGRCSVDLLRPGRYKTWRWPSISQQDASSWLSEACDVASVDQTGFMSCHCCMVSPSCDLWPQEQHLWAVYRQIIWTTSKSLTSLQLSPSPVSNTLCTTTLTVSLTLSTTSASFVKSL